MRWMHNENGGDPTVVCLYCDREEAADASRSLYCFCRSEVGAAPAAGQANDELPETRAA